MTEIFGWVWTYVSLSVFFVFRSCLVVLGIGSLFRVVRVKIRVYTTLGVRLYFQFYFAKQYLGLVEHYVEFLKTKLQNVVVGGGEEMRISYQQHPPSLLESQ